jgi:hypothetical protein
MAITINGNGTVTGVSVGGLPDGIVDTDMLAADAVTAPKIGTKSYVSCACIADKKSANTAGGSSTADSHVQRDLNHEFYDPDGIVSISSNQFTLVAGTYIIEWSAPAYNSLQHISRLREVTDGTIQEGSAEYSNDYTQSRSVGSARVIQTGSKTYRIEHRVNTSKDTNGFGVASNNHSNYDVYTLVKIYKEA